MARTRISLVAAMATIAALAAPTTALAGETSCDGLSQELSTATEGEVVTLVDDEVCFGHFTLPSHAITFQGGAGVATLSGDGEQKILSGDSVGATTIRNLTFIDGSEGEGDGGAIDINGNSPVTIEGNGFFSNDAEDDGGAVNLELDNQVFTENAARGELLPVVLRDNTFGGPDEGNRADDEGGAVYIDAFFRSVIVEDNTFADNVANDDDGGGLEINEANRVTLDNNTFTGNEGADNGGGASVNTCAAEITDNVFDGNLLSAGEADLDGGGLFLGGRCGGNDDLARGGEGGETVTQSGNLFTGNQIDGRSSSGDGGGEYIEFFTVQSTNDRFVGNSISVTDGATGGGLAYQGEVFTARNLVAAGNEVLPTEPPSRGSFGAGRGGGLSLIGDGSESEYRIEDSTIESNTAQTGSGIAGDTIREGLTRGLAPQQLVLENSIVFNNSGASDSPEDEFDGEIDGFAEARAVQFSDTCVDGEPHEDADGGANSNICVDPELAAPGDDGNVDQTAGSPTREAGDNALVDEDLAQDYAGDGRVLDSNSDGTARVDIGADEAPGATVEPTPEPTVQPPAAQPAPQGAVQGQTQRSCRSKRVFRIRIRVPRGKKARFATVRVNNRKVKVIRGKRLRAPVRLSGLPKGRFTVRITIRLTNGKKVTGKRTYHTCIPKRPGDGPPPV